MQPSGGIRDRGSAVVRRGWGGDPQRPGRGEHLFTGALAGCMRGACNVRILGRTRLLI